MLAKETLLKALCGHMQSLTGSNMVSDSRELVLSRYIDYPKRIEKSCPLDSYKYTSLFISANETLV